MGAGGELRLEYGFGEAFGGVEGAGGDEERRISVAKPNGLQDPRDQSARARTPPPGATSFVVRLAERHRRLSIVWLKPAV